MNQMHLFLRRNLTKNLLFANSRILQFRNKNTNNNNDNDNNSSSSASSDSSSSSSSENDDKKVPANKLDDKTKSNEALTKLNSLLKSMIEEEVVSSESKLNLAKPKNKRLKHLQEPGTESVKVQSAEKQMVKAVQDVAQAIGGNTKQTESELLLKLLKPTENDNDNKEASPALNLTDIVKGMKIDRETKPESNSRAEQVRQLMLNIRKEDSELTSSVMKRRPRPPMQTCQTSEVREKIDLFGSEPLGVISTEQMNSTEGVENKTWNELYETELKLAVTHPPANYFQQMILWTEQGKIWKFPIDNEQGMESEKNVYFAEHVFLEKHLESWCPTKGPIRHFMELVCVGLSKNPYITVQDKKDHIKWFQNYFEEKRQLLEEVGALGNETQKGEEQKKIEG